MFRMIKEGALANLYLFKIHLLISKLYMVNIISIWLTKTLR